MMEFRPLSLRMASVARRADVLVSISPRMGVVRARLVVFMAVDALKRAVICLVHMAVGTRIPPAGTVMASRTDGEPLVMRKQ
jgi:hypothetical protein